MAQTILTSFIVLTSILLTIVALTDGRLSLKSNPQSNQRVIERFESFANGLIGPSLQGSADAGEQEPSLTKGLKVSKFIWSSCSSPDSLVKLRKLEVSDPISVPGEVTVTFDSEWTTNITSPLRVALSVQRKVTFFWVDVPCIRNVGSCNYDDFCSVIPYPHDQPCPEPFHSMELPCYCPGPKGVYAKENLIVPIPDEHIPEILARGQYSVGAKAWIGNQEVICLKFSFSLA